MAFLNFLRGKRNNLPESCVDGQVYFCSDDASLHVDYLDDDGNIVRLQTNAKDAETLSGASLSSAVSDNETAIPTSKAVYDLAITKADDYIDYSMLSFDTSEIVFDSASSTSSVLGVAVLGQMVLA